MWTERDGRRFLCSGQGPPSASRREFLSRLGGGFGAVAASYLLERDGFAAETDPVDPLAPKKPHFAPKAKAVIQYSCKAGRARWIRSTQSPYCSACMGSRLRPSIVNSGSTFLQFTNLSEAPILAPKATFKKYGQSGLEISSLFPNIANFADDLAVIRSCYHDSFTHGPAVQVLIPV